MRRLLDWVDDHDEADARREEAKAVAVRNAKLQNIVAELKALDTETLDKIEVILAAR